MSELSHSECRYSSLKMMMADCAAVIPRNATRLHGMTKLLEESGELARHAYRGTRDDGEIADIMICILMDAHMSGATWEDIASALVHKIARLREREGLA